MKNEFVYYTGNMQQDIILNCKVDELKENGVDLIHDDYYKHPEFIKLRQKYIIGLGISVDWMIEKYVVGQDRLEKIYGCYDLRIERELTENECQRSTWFSSLSDLFPTLCRSGYDIYQYFYRNKDGQNIDERKGLVGRLRDWGLDIDQFDNKSEKIRLLFYLYCFEVNHNVKLASFLKNPTLENVDNSLVGDITRNGELMAELKNTISKAISTDFIQHAKKTISYIPLQWQTQMAKIHMIASNSPKKIFTRELVRIDAYLDLMLKQSSISNKKGGIYRHSLLETFYLKLLQHENLGRENDIIDVANATEHHYAASIDNIERYNSMLNKTVKKDDVRKFIETNRSNLAHLVFNKDKISSNEYAKFDTAAEKVPDFLDMLDENTLYAISDSIPQLMIVACIEEFMLIGKEVIENHFYRYKSADQKTLKAEMKNGVDAFEKNKLAWITRINIRLKKYTGKSANYLYASKIEKHLDLVIKKILMCNSTDDMLYLNNYFMTLFDAFSARDEKILREKNTFLNELHSKFEFTKEYELVGDSFYIIFLFATLINSHATKTLAKVVGEAMCHAERAMTYLKAIYPIEMEENYLNKSDIYEAVFSIDPFKKKIELSRFVISAEGEYAKALNSNGIID